MTKPRLVKVRALLYVFQHVIKKRLAYFDTASYLHVYAHSPCECAYRRAGSVRKPQVKKP